MHSFEDVRGASKASEKGREGVDRVSGGISESAASPGDLEAFRRDQFRSQILEVVTQKRLATTTFLTILYSLAVPFATQAIIDRVIVHNGAHSLGLIFILLVATAVLDAMTVTLRSAIGAYVANDVASTLTARLTQRFLAQPASAVLGDQGNRLAQSIAQANGYRESLMEVIAYFYQALLPMVVYAVVVVLINPTMSGIVAVSMTIYLLLYLALRGPMKKHARRAIHEHVAFGAAVHRAAAAIETIKAYGLSSRAIKTANDLSFSAFYSGFQAGKRAALWQGISRAISGLTQATLLLYGAAATIRGQLTLGELVAFQMFASRLLEPLTRAGGAWERLTRLKLYLDDWAPLLGAPAPQRLRRVAPAKREGAVLEAQDLEFAYPGTAGPQLRGIDLRIEPGEAVFLLGPSGSGKSTFVRLAAGLLAPTGGKILISGQDLATLDEACRLRLVACSLQEPVLLPGSVSQNIAAFRADVSEARIHAAAELTKASSFIDRMPEGFGTLLGEHGFAVSGGEKQRLCLARMVATKASLLIIDEGTSGLERKLEASILEGVKAQLEPHQAMIVITHREDTAALGTRTIRLEQGEITTDLRLEVAQLETPS